MLFFTHVLAQNYMNENEVLSVLNQIPSVRLRDIYTHRVAGLYATIEQLEELGSNSSEAQTQTISKAIESVRYKIDDIMIDAIRRFNIQDNFTL